MQLDKVGSLMFYDKDNVLVGAVGFELKTLLDQGIEPIAQAAIMEVFNTEEVARIAYFTVERHYLVLHAGETTEPVERGEESQVLGQTEEGASSPYTQNLVEHELFEKDFYIKHKLDALRILHEGESFKMQQSLLVKSLMHDLGVDTEQNDYDTPD